MNDAGGENAQPEHGQGAMNVFHKMDLEVDAQNKALVSGHGAAQGLTGADTPDWGCV